MLWRTKRTMGKSAAIFRWILLTSKMNGGLRSRDVSDVDEEDRLSIRDNEANWFIVALRIQQTQDKKQRKQGGKSFAKYDLFFLNKKVKWLKELQRRYSVCCCSKRTLRTIPRRIETTSAWLARSFRAELFQRIGCLSEVSHIGHVCLYFYVIMWDILKLRQSLFCSKRRWKQ